MKYSILGSFKKLIDSIAKTGSKGDGRVSVNDLSKEEKEELNQVLKASGGRNIRTVDDLANRYKYKANPAQVGAKPKVNEKPKSKDDENVRSID